MSGSSGEKTEKATPKKRKQSRREGQIARTPDLGGWASVLVLSMVVGPLLRHEGDALRALLVGSLQAAQDPTPSTAFRVLRSGALHAFVAVLVVSGISLFVGVASAVAQGGLVVSPKLVAPKLSKLDPIKGFKRVFGPQAAWSGAKMLIKSTLVALVAWIGIRGVMPMVGGLVPMGTVLSVESAHVLTLLRTVAIAGLLMAGADYAVQRRRTNKQTMMTKHEIKQEHKQSEGDPLVKGAIRSRQLAAARSRMLADVATADVLLVNPTHVAIALSYDAERGAPRVVARGAGAIAARIRELAAEARVPLVQDVPLARALYRSTEVGQEIPPELWAAVAQVLAFVITRRRAGQYGGEHRTPRSTEPLPATLTRAQRSRRRPSDEAASGR